MDELIIMIDLRLEEMNQLHRRSIEELSIDETLRLIVDLRHYNKQTESLIRKLKRLLKDDFSSSRRSTREVYYN